MELSKFPSGPERHTDVCELYRGVVVVDEKQAEHISIDDNEFLHNSLKEDIYRFCSLIATNENWHETVYPVYIFDIRATMKYLEDDLVFRFKNKKVADTFIANIGYRYFRNINIDI